jgi:hypothetical protein
MVCISVFRELNVLASLPQPLHIGAARTYGHVVVGDTMKQTNGTFDNVSVINIRGVTRSVKGHVYGELNRVRCI